MKRDKETWAQRSARIRNEEQERAFKDVLYRTDEMRARMPLVGECKPEYIAKPGIDRAAAAFMDGMTDGNMHWENAPEHTREKFREGIRAILTYTATPVRITDPNADTVTVEISMPTAVYVNEQRQPPKLGFHDDANAYISKTGSDVYTLGTSCATAEQAREAAHLLNQLAEFLEWQQAKQS